MMALMVVIIAAASTMIAQGWSPGRPALGPARPTRMTGEDAAYFAYVAPRLDAVITEGDSLVALSAAKSRNIFALRRGQNRIEELLKELDVPFMVETPPRRFPLSHQTYVAAASSMRAGIDASRTAVAHLDWDGLMEAAATFRLGVDDLKAARRELDMEAGLPDSTRPVLPMKFHTGGDTAAATRETGVDTVAPMFYKPFLTVIAFAGAEYPGGEPMSRETSL